jgi:hypothetical protein
LPLKTYRRLRRLVPDLGLVHRRAAGASLRELANDYRVAHTTLGRYFARPDVAKQLNEARRLQRHKDQAARALLANQRRLEREVRTKAKEQVAWERRRQVLLGHFRSRTRSGIPCMRYGLIGATRACG